MVGLTAPIESSTHGQLDRIERTLRRTARRDSLARYERKVHYPPFVNPGIDLVKEALHIESLGQFDSAIKMSSKAVLYYESALDTVPDTTERWALGEQLHDKAEYNLYRVAQKEATTKSFQIQTEVAWVAFSIGIVVFLLGALVTLTAAVRLCRRNPTVIPAPGDTTGMDERIRLNCGIVFGGVQNRLVLHVHEKRDPAPKTDEQPAD